MNLFRHSKKHLLEFDPVLSESTIDIPLMRDSWEGILLLTRRRLGPEAGTYYSELGAKTILKLLDEIERNQIIVDEAAAVAFSDDLDPTNAPQAYKLVVENLQNAFVRSRKTVEE